MAAITCVLGLASFILLLTLPTGVSSNLTVISSSPELQYDSLYASQAQISNISTSSEKTLSVSFAEGSYSATSVSSSTLVTLRTADAGLSHTVSQLSPSVTHGITSTLRTITGADLSHTTSHISPSVTHGTSTERTIIEADLSHTITTPQISTSTTNGTISILRTIPEADRQHNLIVNISPSVTHGTSAERTITEADLSHTISHISAPVTHGTSAERTITEADLSHTTPHISPFVTHVTTALRTITGADPSHTVSQLSPSLTHDTTSTLRTITGSELSHTISHISPSVTHETSTLRTITEADLSHRISQISTSLTLGGISTNGVSEYISPTRAYERSKTLTTYIASESENQAPVSTSIKTDLPSWNINSSDVFKSASFENGENLATSSIETTPLASPMTFSPPKSSIASDASSLTTVLNEIGVTASQPNVHVDGLSVSTSPAEITSFAILPIETTPLSTPIKTSFSTSSVNNAPSMATVINLISILDSQATFTTTEAHLSTTSSEVNAFTTSPIEINSVASTMTISSPISSVTFSVPSLANVVNSISMYASQSTSSVTEAHLSTTSFEVDTFASIPFDSTSSVINVSSLATTLDSFNMLGSQTTFLVADTHLSTYSSEVKNFASSPIEATFITPPSMLSVTSESSLTTAIDFVSMVTSQPIFSVTINYLSIPSVEVTSFGSQMDPSLSTTSSIIAVLFPPSAIDVNSTPPSQSSLSLADTHLVTSFEELSVSRSLESSDTIMVPSLTYTKEIISWPTSQSYLTFSETYLATPPLEITSLDPSMQFSSLFFSVTAISSPTLASDVTSILPSESANQFPEIFSSEVLTPVSDDLNEIQTTLPVVEIEIFPSISSSMISDETITAPDVTNVLLSSESSNESPEVFSSKVSTPVSDDLNELQTTLPVVEIVNFSTLSPSTVIGDGITVLEFTTDYLLQTTDPFFATSSYQLLAYFPNDSDDILTSFTSHALTSTPYELASEDTERNESTTSNEGYFPSLFPSSSAIPISTTSQQQSVQSTSTPYGLASADTELNENTTSNEGYFPSLFPSSSAIPISTTSQQLSVQSTHLHGSESFSSESDIPSNVLSTDTILNSLRSSISVPTSQFPSENGSTSSPINALETSSSSDNTVALASTQLPSIPSTEEMHFTETSSLNRATDQPIIGSSATLELSHMITSTRAIQTESAFLSTAMQNSIGIDGTLGHSDLPTVEHALETSHSTACSQCDSQISSSGIIRTDINAVYTSMIESQSKYPTDSDIVHSSTNSVLRSSITNEPITLYSSTLTVDKISSSSVLNIEPVPHFSSSENIFVTSINNGRSDANATSSTVIGTQTSDLMPIIAQTNIFSSAQHDSSLPSQSGSILSTQSQMSSAGDIPSYSITQSPAIRDSSALGSVQHVSTSSSMTAMSSSTKDHSPSSSLLYTSNTTSMPTPISSTKIPISRFFKNLTIIFYFEGDCNLIRDDNLIYRKFWRAMLLYIENASKRIISQDDISIEAMECDPFYAMVSVTVKRSVELAEILGDYFHSKIFIKLDNGTDIVVTITHYELNEISPNVWRSADNLMKTSEIVVITFASIICAVIVTVGIVISIREYLIKRRTERFRFFPRIFDGVNREQVSLRRISAANNEFRSSREMHDHGSLSGRNGSVCDGEYSTIGSHKGKKTTFMTESDMGRLNGLSSKKRGSSSVPHKPQPTRGYGLIIGLLGYKPPKPEETVTYAVPSKKEKVQGLSIRATGEEENATTKQNNIKNSLPGDKSRQSVDASPTPPPRNMKKTSNKKEMRDTVENLQAPREKPKSEDIGLCGVVNPAFTYYDETNIDGDGDSNSSTLI